MDLVNKILGVKKNNIGIISPADVEFMEQLHTSFKRICADHDIWEMIAKSKLQEVFKGSFEIKTHYNDRPYITINTSELPGYFNDMLFNPDSIIGGLHELRKELVQEYNYKIFEYFNDTYNLSIKYGKYNNNPTLPAFIKEPHYSVVIDYIFLQLPCANLAEYKTHSLIENFKNKVCGNTTIVAKGNTLTFKYFRPWGHGKIDLQETGAQTFFGGLGYFETGDVTNYIIGELPNDGYVEYGRSYSLQAVKLQSIKMFQNSKAIITFEDAHATDEFVKLFNIKLSKSLK